MFSWRKLYHSTDNHVTDNQPQSFLTVVYRCLNSTMLLGNVNIFYIISHLLFFFLQGCILVGSFRYYQKQLTSSFKLGIVVLYGQLELIVLHHEQPILTGNQPSSFLTGVHFCWMSGMLQETVNIVSNQELFCFTAKWS